MRTDYDNDLERFFSSLKDFDTNMLVIEEYKREMVKRQGTFSETD
jgi:hypothetical protein